MEEKNNQQTTLDDVLLAVNDLAQKTEEKFEKIDSRFEKIDSRFEKIDKQLIEIKSTMVTKDYLDDKLADLKGDMVVLMRKEDTKLKTLVDILENKKLISAEDKQHIFSLEPFAALT